MGLPSLPILFFCLISLYFEYSKVKNIGAANAPPAIQRLYRRSKGELSLVSTLVVPQEYF